MLVNMFSEFGMIFICYHSLICYYHDYFVVSIMYYHYDDYYELLMIYKIINHSTF